MTLDDQLRRTMASLTDRVREEAERQITALAAEFDETIKSERASAAAQASAEARAAVERDVTARLTAVAAAAAAHEKEAVAAVETRQREALNAATAAVETRERAAAASAVAAAVAAAEAKGRDALAAAEARVAAARDAGRGEGHAAGKAEGEEWGRAEGYRGGLEEGCKEGRIEGRIEGREEGREEGRLEGRRAGYEMGLKEGKRLGKDEGRKEALAVGHEKGRLESAAQALAQGKEQGRIEGLQQGRQEGMEAAYAECRTTELAANERLLEAIRAIDGARSLTEALDALTSSAGREAARVAVLLVRSGELRGWRFIGFGAPLDERHDFSVPSGDAGVIAEAARTGLAVSADSATTRSAPAFAELPPGREVLAVPVQMSGQVIAVLYADQGVERTSVNISWPSTLEVLARHAARSLESITAFRAAQVLTGRPDITPKTGYGGASIQAASSEHVEAARRYARLLVSEIKLHHENAVLTGRRERNLATRLGGEIARARVLYEQRAPSGARLAKDYFHEELVRTLADGDESLLEIQR